MSFAVGVDRQPDQGGEPVPHVLPTGLWELAFYASGLGPAK
jgi:hypothetical protein